MAKRINPNERLDALLPYSQAIMVEAGRTLYVSGQVGINADGTCPAEFPAQAERAFVNLGGVLATAGMDVEDIVKLTVFLTDAADYTKFGGIRAAFLGDHKPASTLLIVAGLARAEWKVEIEAVAAG